MRLRHEDLEPIADALSGGVRRFEEFINRTFAPYFGKASDDPALDERRAPQPPGFRDLEETDPLRDIVRRVSSGETLEEGDLHVLRSACEKLDRREWKRALVTAWILGRATVRTDLRDRALGILASCLQNRQYASNACTVTIALGCLLNWLLGLPVALYIIARDGRVSAIRTEAAASLALLDCEWAVGDLAEAVRTRNRPGSGRLRETASMALKRLLPKIGPKHYGRMPAAAVSALCRLLDDRHHDLHVPVLGALTHIGGTSAARAIANLTNEGWPEATRQKAREALEAVKARAELEREASRLLRPAQAPGTPEDVLLRPAEAPPSGDVELLVRPVEDQAT